MKKYLLFFVSVLIIFSCSDKKHDECVFAPDVSPGSVNLKIENLEDSIANIKTKEQLVGLLTRQPLLRDYFFKRTSYPSDSVFINTIFKRVTNPHFDSLLYETKKKFGDGSFLKDQFEQAFANLKYYYPNTRVPKIQTVISGLDNDLFVSDSLIMVSLDFYLGKGAKYRPNMYEYLLRQYEPSNIVPSVMLIYGISPRYNAANLNDKTILADMLAYGKSYYFAKHMLPCVPDSVLTWYTQEEIEGSRKNQDLIWKRFVEDRVLYSTSHTTKQKFLGERPRTVEVGEKCPGRIGQWIGWQIVNAYMDSHEATTLPQLMKISNAEKLFKESRYKP
jgi:hypothetical protein